MSEIIVAQLEMTNAGNLGWTAYCPEHGRFQKIPTGKDTYRDGKWFGKKSTVVRGQQQDFDGKHWLTFRCTEKGGHLFNALMPKDAPKTVEQAKQLKLKLLLAKADSNPDKQRKSGAA